MLVAIVEAQEGAGAAGGLVEQDGIVTVAAAQAVLNNYRLAVNITPTAASSFTSGGALSKVLLSSVVTFEVWSPQPAPSSSATASAASRAVLAVIMAENLFILCFDWDGKANSPAVQDGNASLIFGRSGWF